MKINVRDEMKTHEVSTTEILSVLVVHLLIQNNHEFRKIAHQIFECNSILHAVYF